MKVKRSDFKIKNVKFKTLKLDIYYKKVAILEKQNYLAFKVNEIW